MRFNLIIFTLLFFNPICFSDEKVTVQILSKFQIKELSVLGNFKINGVKKEFLKLKVIETSKNGILVDMGTDKSQTDSVALNADEGAFLEFKVNNKSDKRFFKGDLLVKKDRGNGRFVFLSSVDFEQYINTVVQSEIGQFFNDGYLNDEQQKELYRAFSIVVRSYAYKNKRRHGHLSDYCDLTHCMVFKDSESFQIHFSEEPVVLKKNGKIVEAFFHSTCGGKLTSPSVWWGNVESSDIYRYGKDGSGNDLNCSNSPHFAWFFQLDKRKIKDIFSIEINDILLTKSEERVSSIEFINGKKTYIYKIAEFSSKIGKALGWNKLKSNDFTVRNIGKSFIFNGNGLGHGIGMCQYGARNLARSGKSYKDILNFYFPGATIEKI